MREGEVIDSLAANAHKVERRVEVGAGLRMKVTSAFTQTRDMISPQLPRNHNTWSGGLRPDTLHLNTYLT